MSTISRITPLCETAGSAAARTNSKANECGPNCPPNCPDCGQVNFKQNGDVYESYDKTRKKKRNTALLISAGILAVGAGAMIGLGRLHNSEWIAGLSDGWFKTGMESVSRGCNNACTFIKNKAVGAWDWIKNIGKNKS